MKPADGAPDLADCELSHQVTVLFVGLLEVVYIGHNDAQGFAFLLRPRQRLLQLLIEAGFYQQAGQVIVVESMAQVVDESGLQRVLGGKLHHAPSELEALPVGERARPRQDLPFSSVRP